MPKKARPKATKKEFILKKASTLFREKGFAASSMRDLADDVGLEAASLYNHIQSKSEILQEIIFKSANECSIQLEAINKSKISSVDKVESIIRFHTQMMIYNFDHYFVMTHEWMHLSEPYLTTFITQRKNYVQQFEEIVNKGIQKKEIKPILPYVFVLNILSAVSGLEFWHRSKQKTTPKQLEDNMVLHLITGLKLSSKK